MPSSKHGIDCQSVQFLLVLYMNPYENGLMSIPHYRYISISSNSYISHRWSPLKSSEFLHLWPASSFLWPISLSSSSCFRGGSAGVSVVETACLRDSVKLATLQPFSRLGAAPHITFSLCKSTSWKVGWNARSYPQPNRLRQPVMLLSFPNRAPCTNVLGVLHELSDAVTAGK